MTGKRVKVWLWNLLIAVDQLGNAVLAGSPDETLSARTHRKAQAGQKFWRALRWVIDRIFFFDRDHCRTSYENELARGHCPQEMKNG